jgi:hypothetical protein
MRPAMYSRHRSTDGFCARGSTGTLGQFLPLAEGSFGVIHLADRQGTLSVLRSRRGSLSQPFRHGSAIAFRLIRLQASTSSAASARLCARARRNAGYRDLIAPKLGSLTEGAASSALTGQAVANGNAHRLTRNLSSKLSTTARGKTFRHGGLPRHLTQERA